jgi:acetyltransferase-like isoleucine patch superfamily enzyme
VTTLILDIRRGSTPFHRAVRGVARRARRFSLPRPAPLRPLLRLLYHLHRNALRLFRHARAVLYYTPLFAGRCESAGRGLYVYSMPEVAGHTRIHLGDNVHILGKMAIASARVCDEPTLTIGDRVIIGHEVRFSVNREVRIEDEVFIAARATIADNDGHPLDPERRVRHEPPAEAEIKPVRIGRRAWIGHGAHVRKGVTIGEAAVIGASSVVLRSIPAYSIAHGAPARVVGFVPRGAVEAAGESGAHSQARAAGE